MEAQGYAALALAVAARSSMRLKCSAHAGIDVPKGTLVFTIVWWMLHDVSVWGAPCPLWQLLTSIDLLRDTHAAAGTQSCDLQGRTQPTLCPSAGSTA